MIFQIGKTRFRLSFSFVALIVTMIILCEERIVLCSLVSSIVHECGHIFFMYISGDTPRNIEFTIFGIRIDRNSGVGVSYCKEIIIALGGIIFNIIFAGICYVLYVGNASENYLIFSVVNIIIAAVNSFPVSVIDCGRAVRYAFLIYKDKESSEKYSDCISKIFVIIFTVASSLYFLIFGINISLFAINIYLILITIIKKWS